MVLAHNRMVAAQPGLEVAPDIALANQDMAAVVYRFVDELPPDQRETVHLHYYQGLTIKETADAMEVATSTVKYRLRQALDSIRNNLARPQQPASQHSRRETMTTTELGKYLKSSANYHAPADAERAPAG